MHYVLDPPRNDARYSLSTGRGNCQNYAHLAAALMRAVGIPVRIVNGVVLDRPYDIDLPGEVLTMKMARGRHAWIEVYFSDLEWVPFDPAGTEMFVSNRFVRIETGLDNDETKQDGLLRWSPPAPAPRFEESIEASFVDDSTRLTARRTEYGPRELLLCPPVDAPFERLKRPPVPGPPIGLTPTPFERLAFSVPIRLGNLEFPRRIDFFETRREIRPGPEGTSEMRKTFLVETAEYVTTQGRQYAQVFILDRPIRLQKIGLALHRFGGHGQLWIELFADHRQQPGRQIATSRMTDLAEIPVTAGYDWFDFDFDETDLKLSPGAYWITLGFTGRPIVNWFFSYGKPAGPLYGTRYKTLFDADWSRSLAYEFNYRVIGDAPAAWPALEKHSDR